MKKFLLFAMIFAAVAVTFTSCGDDKDEPAPIIDPVEGVYSVLTGGGNYNTTNEKFYHFDFFGAKGKNLYIHNIKFVEAMPAQKQIRIPIDPSKLAATGDVYKVHLDEVVPYFLSGTVEIPMEARKITNLDLTVDCGKKTYQISFTCFGLDFKDSGNLKL